MLNKLYSYFFNKANLLRSSISKKEGESPWKVKTFSALNLFVMEMMEDLFKLLILLFKNPYDSFQLFTKQETLPICEYSYTDHRRFQKKVRLFSLAGLSSVISATIIINLILSLVIPGQIPSYAKTVNGGWDDWSLTDLAGDPPAGSAGTLSISPASSSEISGTGTAATLGLKLSSYSATDGGGALNPGFESGTTVDADSWTESGNADRVSDRAYSGSYSMKFINISAAQATAQNISVNANTKYMLSGWIYKDYNGGSYLDLSDISEECSAYSSSALNAWQFVSCSFTTGASRTSVTVRMVVDLVATGNVWFDDISLLATTGSATGGTFGAGTNSSTVVSGAGTKVQLGTSSTISTGADGACSFAGGTINTNTKATYECTTVSITGTNTVTGSSPLTIKASGSVTVSGILSLNGGNGGAVTTYACGYDSYGNPLTCFNDSSGGVAGAGGSGGGAGKAPGGGAYGVAGSGVGGGGGGYSTYSGGGGGGFGGAGGVGASCYTGGAAGSTYGTITGTDGGSGGGGGHTTGGGFGAATGGGGGAGSLKIISESSIIVNSGGIIRADGGSPPAPASITIQGGGGGGSGGRISLISALTITNNGAISAKGGAGGAVSSSCCGGGGGGGRILIQDGDAAITGTAPTATYGVKGAGGGSCSDGTTAPISYSSASNFYPSSGTFTSAAIDLGGAAGFTGKTMTWSETLPTNTDIQIQMRSASTQGGLASATWYGPTGTGDWYTASGSSINTVHNGAQWVQYKAVLTSPSPYTTTPSLNSVTINYEQYPSTSTITNIRFNTTYSAVKWTSVAFVTNSAVSSSVNVKVQARTAGSGTALATQTNCSATAGDFCGSSDGTTANTSSSTYFDLFGSGQTSCSQADGKFGDTSGDNATKKTVTCAIDQNNTKINPSSNQWLELKLKLDGGGSATPIIDAARATYSVNGNPEVCYTLTDATTCNTAVSLVASQSQSPANYGHIALNSYIRDTDTDTGTTSPGQVLIGLEYSDSSGIFSQSSPPSTAAYYTLGNFAQNYTITPNDAGVTCSDLDPTGTSTSAFRYLCNVNDNHPGNAYQNGISPNNFASFTIDWNAKQDLTRYSTAQKVRILVNDQEGIGPVNVSNPGTSGAFTIDTANPTGSMIFSSIPSGVSSDTTSPGITITASDDTTVAYKVSNNCYTGAAGSWETLYSSWVSPLSNPIGCSFLTSNENADRIHAPYFSLRDAYGNELVSSFVVSGQRPINLTLQDVSNVLASPASYKNFISWEIAAIPANGFGSYNVYRCAPPEGDPTCSQSSSYSLYGTAIPTGDRNVNYFTDSNVSSDATYYYRVATKDSLGNISNWSSAVWGIANGTQDGGEGGGGGDATPPTISALSIADKTQTSAKVIWTTLESAAAGVFYSTDTLYGSEKSTLSYQTAGYDAVSASTGRAINLAGLNANATYNIQLKSTDASGNITICDATTTASTTTATSNKTTAINNADYCPSGAVYSFDTLTQDVSAPVISAVTTTEVTHNSAKVSWTTDENSDSCVGYDSASTRTYASEQCSSTQTQLHSVTLGSLSPTTTYYVKIKSRDSAGNLAQNCSTESKTDCSAETTFSFLTSITPAPATGGGGGGGKSDFTAPTIINIKVSNITKDSAIIAWNTGEAASSLVQYGKSDNLLSSTGGQIDTEFEHKVTLKGLEPDTEYFFKANSIDWAGNIGVSEIQSFATEKASTIEEEVSKLSTPEIQEKTKEVLKGLEEQIRAQKEDIVDPLQILLDALSPLVPEPIIIGESPTIEVAATSASISWRTDKKSTSFVALSREDQFNPASQEPYKTIIGNPEDSIKEHKVEITGLLPATKYHYQVRSKALLGNTSESKDFTFTTKSELPQITSFLQKKTENEKTAVIYWETNIPTDSVVKYTPYIKGKLSPKDAKLQGKPDMISDHEITLTSLDPGTVYQIEISGKDPFGNSVSKTLPDFTTAIDKDAPVISQVRIESAMISGKTPKIQTIISYRTDEPANSQVYFAEGGSDKFKQMTPDLNLSTIHTSVVTDFKPASIYRIRIESSDESGNTATSRDFTILTPAQSESIIDIIVKTFENTFGWVKNIRF